MDVDRFCPLPKSVVVPDPFLCRIEHAVFAEHVCVVELGTEEHELPRKMLHLVSRKRGAERSFDRSVIELVSVRFLRFA